MTSSPGSMLAALSQVNWQGDLTHRVKDLPVPQFASLLEQITKEFEYFLRAIELINNEALETMLEQILEAFTLKIGQILEADRTTIFLVDEEKEQLWSKVAQDETGKVLEIRVSLNMGIAGHVATTGTCLNIPDAYSHPLFNQDVDRQTGYRTRNILCMPIFNTKNRVVAVVQLLNKAGDQPFDTADELQFRQFAASIGIILESCNSFYVAARNQRGVAALLKATSCLGQSLDLEKTLRAVMNEARDLMQADRSTLFLLDHDKAELWSKVATADGKTIVEIRIPANRGIAGYVASTGQTLNIPNAYEDPRFDPSTDRRTGYLTRNILCMPVYNPESLLIGVTQLINKSQGCFTASDEEFMKAFNIQAGIALENARLFESVMLEKQYQKDMLQSLSDAVISTDMQGKIVTINNAALKLLGCPTQNKNGQQELYLQQQELWLQKLVGRSVWEVVPIDILQSKLENSLKTGAKYSGSGKSLEVGRVMVSFQTEVQTATLGEEMLEASALVIRDRTDSTRLHFWGSSVDEGSSADDSRAQPVTEDQVQWLERSINLTVNPLTNPEGKVQGGLVVLEDISPEKRLRTLMNRYMTEDVAERVIALGEDALNERKRKDVTILFSDIRGYTSLTEKMEATEVVSLLNNYFETMVEAVFSYEGTLDKFMGDALMAVFGAPLELKDHALMAVKSALDMRKRLKKFNADRQLNNQSPIRIGIGISSGEVVSGTIGSQKRMDYTVIGNGVDISSRLEGVTKEYGCDIILSQHTYDLCSENIWVRELDRIRVKGKSEPISIYELVSDRSHPLSPATQDFLELYQLGRAAYTNLDFRQAIHHFETAQNLRPDDRAIEVHLERAAAYLLNPPPTLWDGVHTMMTK